MHNLTLPSCTLLQNILVFICNTINSQYWYAELLVEQYESLLKFCVAFWKQNALVIQIIQVLLDFCSILFAAGVNEFLFGSVQGGNARDMVLDT